MLFLRTTTKALLAQIPFTIPKDMAMPPAQAMKLLRPALCQHADLEAVDRFERWVLQKPGAISLENLADQWIHYERCFIAELPMRFTRWASDRSEPSPYQLGVEFARLMRLRRWNPWVLRRSQTVWGRAQIKAVVALGNTLLFIFALWLALGAWTFLATVREPILMGMARIGRG